VINSAEGGGAAFPVPRIVRTLRRHGAEVRLFVLIRRDGRALPHFEEAGIEVALREGGRDDHLAALRWLMREVAKWRPDALWTSLTRATLLGQLVGRSLGLPVVSWQHAAYLKPANLFLLRRMAGLSALWIGDSEAISAMTADRLRIPPEQLVTWPIFAADPDAPQARPWTPGEPLRMGSLGRLHPVKGYDLLLGAIVQLKREGFDPPTPLRLTIAGEGAERERLTAMRDAAGLTCEVDFPGFAESSSTFLSNLHLYLQPSRGEGFCVAAHEAMQAGLPVLGSAVGEMAFSILPGHTGDLVPPGNEAALADALRRMLAQPQHLAAMGDAARARVLSRFSEEAFDATGRAILERLGAIVQERRSAAAARTARSA